jgi:hypothetical protein
MKSAATAPVNHSMDYSNDDSPSKLFNTNVEANDYKDSIVMASLYERDLFFTDYQRNINKMDEIPSNGENH